MPDLFGEFRGIVSALVQAGVPFAVCGGIAMAIHARLIRTALAALPPGRVDEDAVLATLRAAVAGDADGAEMTEATMPERRA
jgi:hypothetical protein